MPLWLYSLAFGLTIVLALVSGIWLLLHLRDVARVFRRRGEITPGPGRRGASAAKVWTVLVLFNLGWIGAVLFWIFTNTDRATAVVEAGV